jgi:hypothetical protein
MQTLDSIAKMEPEVQHANLCEMMSRGGRYVVFDSANDLHPQEMAGFTSLRAAQMFRALDIRLHADILDRQTQDIL